MLLRCFAIAVILMSSGAAAAQDFCAHKDTNGLAWNKAFPGSVKAYFGGEKAYLFWKNATIAEQVLSGLGGPPDELKKLDGNMALASACRQHSCPEKAAVVLQCPAQIAAIGVIHYCSEDRPGCDMDLPQLTLFSDGTNQQAHAALKQWAAQALATKSEGMRVRVRSPLITTP